MKDSANDIDVGIESEVENGWRLFSTMEEVSSFLKNFGCRKVENNNIGGGWRFDTTLPQSLRNEMLAKRRAFCVSPGIFDGAVFFYNAKSCLIRKIKYLRPFSAENVEVEIGGRVFHYFMTNDEKALTEKLYDFGCSMPDKKEWRVNYALHKNVIDKMSELGAEYSITSDFNICVMNRYVDGGVPSIVDLEMYSKKCRKLMPAAVVNFLIRNDRSESFYNYAKEKDLKLLDEEFVDGWTMLMLAASHNSVKCIDVLIKLGVNINAATKSGVTALMVAAATGRRESVSALLKHNADKDAKSDVGWTAYVYALAHNELEIAELLHTERNADELPSILKFGEKVPFREKLGDYIARFISLGNKKTCEIYKNLKGKMSRQTFSKIQSGKITHPSKEKVILIAIGLHLSLSETEDLLSSLGYFLSDNDKWDSVFIDLLRQRNYDIFEIEAELWKRAKCTLSSRD